MLQDLVNHAISFPLLTFAPSIRLQTMITCPRNDPQCGYKPEKTLSFKEVKIKLVCSEVCVCAVWTPSPSLVAVTSRFDTEHHFFQR